MLNVFCDLGNRSMSNNNNNNMKKTNNLPQNNTNINMNWDIESHRDEHECEEHWQLRKAFMEKWKNDYPEDRLICLARVFANIEFMGCRYPTPLMQEVARLSYEVVHNYRERKKTKLQRTFVSASSAAEDRARGVKRIGGEIVDEKPRSTKIAFIPQGQTDTQDNKSDASDEEGHKNEVLHTETEKDSDVNQRQQNCEQKIPDQNVADEYKDEMMSIKCMNVADFRENMFSSVFGRMVLLVRPWARKLWNMQTSCQVCGLNLTNGYENKLYSFRINGKLLAEATGETKVEARNAAEEIGWQNLRREVISVLIKEQFIAQGDTRISVSDVSGKSKNHDMFGTPVENSVAMKMMKMMGWRGGGLGIDSQGIAEPIKPNLQMVHRAGLGSVKDVRMLRKAALSLMERYVASDTFDLDLVFAKDFAKEERALLHSCAQKMGLASRSYGEGEDRFLVVKKKLDPFSLVRAIIEKGGTTPKYQVFIPAILSQNNRQK